MKVKGGEKVTGKETKKKRGLVIRIIGNAMAYLNGRGREIDEDRRLEISEENKRKEGRDDE